jgi:hypothetical protein
MLTKAPWMMLALLLALAKVATATPFLICDPYPFDSNSPWLNPTTFIIAGLTASPFSVPASINADGSAQLHFDLSNVPFGSYTVTAAAVNTSGGISSPSLPFTFILGNPIPPNNLRLSPN